MSRFLALVKIYLGVHALFVHGVDGYGESEGKGEVEDALMHWFEARGGILGGVEVSKFKGMGRGLRASKRLKDGEPIVTVPLTACITRETALASAKTSGGASSSVPKTLSDTYSAARSDEDVIAYFLLRERALGSASSWAPYLASLPQRVPQGSTLGSQALDLLHDGALRKQLEGRGREIEQRYELAKPHLRALASTVNSKGPGKTASSSFQEQGFALTDWQWALAIVSSRALTFRGERFLVPICDMFNYSPHPDTRLAASGEFYLAHHHLDKEQGLLIVKADRATNAGDQVFEDYGDNSNALYLDHHGFVPHAPNPFDCVSLTLSEQEGSHHHHHHQAVVNNNNDDGPEGAHELLRKMRVPPAPAFCAPPPPKTITSSYSWGLTAPAYVWLAAKSGLDSATLATCHRLLQQRADAMTGGFSSGTSSSSSTIGAPAVTAASVAEEVASGVCPVLTNSNPWAAFPPAGWSPSLAQVQASLLPALQRRLQESPSTISEDEAELASLIELAATAEKEAAAAAAAVGTASAAAVANDKVLALRYRIARKAHLRSLLEYHDEHLSGVGVSVAVEVNSDGTTMTPSSGARIDEGATSSIGSAEDARSRVWVNHSDCEGTTSEASLPCAVAVFNDWVKRRNFPVQKLEAQLVPGMRIGAIATSYIAPEELYLSVPVQACVMDRISAQRSLPLAKLLEKARQAPDPDFFALLFHLLYEQQILREKSVYWPYLALIPALDEIKPPIAYSSAELALLQGSAVQSAVVDYQAKVKQNFAFLSEPRAFGNLVKDVFPNGIDEDTFRWAHYVLDSRSIWWSGMRHLVPLLDLINCRDSIPSTPSSTSTAATFSSSSSSSSSPSSSLPSLTSQRVHSTQLDLLRGTHADTLAPIAFEQGDQVFENYGQPSHVYFLYHGFFLDDNSYDCVLFPMSIGSEDVSRKKGQDANSLRKAMRTAGFQSASQTFCVANAKTLASVAARKQAQQESGDMHDLPLNQVMEPRFLAFLALKYGKTVRDPSLTSDLKDLLLQRLRAYPSSSSIEKEGATAASSSSSAPLQNATTDLQAGLGVGGGAGADHPANKLVAKEKVLLTALLEVL